MTTKDKQISFSGTYMEERFTSVVRIPLQLFRRVAYRILKRTEDADEAVEGDEQDGLANSHTEHQQARRHIWRQERTSEKFQQRSNNHGSTIMMFANGRKIVKLQIHSVEPIYWLAHCFRFSITSINKPQS